MTVSLVTGASTGIGFATALRLAQEGHQVHASVRSDASGQALLDAAGRLDVSLVVMDVDHDDSVARPSRPCWSRPGASTSSSTTPGSPSVTPSRTRRWPTSSGS